MEKKSPADADLARRREMKAKLSFLVSKIEKSMAQGKPCALSRDDVDDIAKCAMKVLQNEPNILETEVSPPIHIVGRIYGNFQALKKVFEIGGPLPYTKYLFLGDYVGEEPIAAKTPKELGEEPEWMTLDLARDQGPQHSVEVLCWLLAYKVIYPENLFLLRGAHEMPAYMREALECTDKDKDPESLVEKFVTGSPRHFASELFVKYGECHKLLGTISKVFQCLPLAGILNKGHLCITRIPLANEKISGLRPIRRYYDQNVIQAFRYEPPAEQEQKPTAVDIVKKVVQGEAKGTETQKQTKTIAGFLKKSNLTEAIVSFRLPGDVQLQKVVNSTPLRDCTKETTVLSVDNHMNLQLIPFCCRPWKPFEEETREELLGHPTYLIF